MRIALISDVYFPRINGVSTSIGSFRQGLAAHGVDTLLIAPDYGREKSEDGILRIPSRPVPRDPEDHLMSYRALLGCLPELRRQGVGAIHVQTPFVAHYAGRQLARRLQLPLLLSYHTLFEEYLHHYVPLLPRALTASLARYISRRQCADAAQVIAPSEAMRARLLEYGVGGQVGVLPTGIDAAAFAGGNRARFRRRLGIAAERPVALYVGRVAFEKNIAFLLEAVDRARQAVPDLLLLIAGEGPARGQLARVVARRGLAGHVRFVGYLERAGELPDCYAAADLFAFASRTETQGLVLLEAMASGLPVLALASMGTASILASERGCRIAPDEPAAFGAVMAALLHGPATLRVMSEQARIHAAEWSEYAMAGRLAEIYRTLLEAAPVNTQRSAPWRARTKGRPV